MSACQECFSIYVLGYEWKDIITCIQNSLEYQVWLVSLISFAACCILLAVTLFTCNRETSCTVLYLTHKRLWSCYLPGLQSEQVATALPTVLCFLCAVFTTVDISKMETRFLVYLYNAYLLLGRCFSHWLWVCKQSQNIRLFGVKMTRMAFIATEYLRSSSWSNHWTLQWKKALGLKRVWRLDFHSLGSLDWDVWISGLCNSGLGKFKSKIFSVGSAWTKVLRMEGVKKLGLYFQICLWLCKLSTHWSLIKLIIVRYYVNTGCLWIVPLSRRAVLCPPSEKG